VKDAPIDLRRPRWAAVFLVCKACGERRNGPKKLKPKALVALVRRESKGLAERTRVMTTGCLGLCPKSAIALAHAGAGSSAAIVAIKSRREGKAAVALIGAKYTAPPSA
jgi:predicted metal-binding protein